MKLKGFALLNSVLTMTLLVLPTLSANALERNNHSLESHSEVTTLIAAAPQDSSNVSKSPDNGFLSKHTTEIEFTFAIMLIIVGLIVSDKLQQHQKEHQLATRESIEATPSTTID